ncbi:homeobox-leucine zipper protein ROC8-like isoform X2 [Lycium barbarum]|uniref:homeobox-leucine zipper protein ROC8-like isoform X2 n=1 Tax=Lycium barbarum TaxID=112863 RepID=UPI00293F0647|nr:homeobox-leucine zipper protein ROC8-like isoform X2 [Lycium barbarum]
MADSREEYAGESWSSKRKSKRQRHTMEQIQQLEIFFKEYPHPDENQRSQLSREVGLDPKQVKFWFQNKRTQTKALSERSGYNTLRTENERYHCENMAMREALKNIICPRCDGSPIGEEERKQNLEKMKIANQQLRNEHERISNLISSAVGKSFEMNSKLAPQNTTLGSSSNSSDESLFSQNIRDSPIGYPPPHQDTNNNNSNNVRENSIDINNIPIITPSPQENSEFHHDNGERSIILEIVVAAMDEIVTVLQVDEPLWIKSPNGVTYSIHRDSYEKMFSNLHQPYKSSSARIESSKDSGVVSMTAIELIQNFLDPIKWMNMFPTMVTKARTIEVFDTGNLGDSIQLMYQKLHILSPLVGARDFFFIRCCRQIDPTTWIMVDVSYDIFREIQSGGPSYWKFPSGCIIQDLGNGKSQVTWLEHVQVDDKNQTHRIYRELVCGRQTYGAKRWIITLQRMCEKYNFAIGEKCPTSHELEGVVNDPEGRKNVMQISQRMVKSFCEILSMSDKVDFPSSPELTNNGIKTSIRKNEEISQPKGVIVTAATSLWFPLSFETVFNFFRDEKTRPQWDVLTNGDAVNELARVITGNFPGNYITIIQPYVRKENMMLVLQETNIDQMGAFLIYAPIDLPTVTSIINGEDSTEFSILPSGFIISPDGRPPADRDSIGNTPNGSVLTVAFQLLVSANDNNINNDSMFQQQNMEAAATIHSLLSSTILNIKEALGCSD